DRNAAFNEPHLAVDASGNVFATDPAKQTVYKCAPGGKLLGSKNAAGNVTLVRPTGLALNKAGEAIVVDTEKNGVVNLGQIP
ncbi:MAG TPA: hypothetical protein VM536_09860, partial [Chloroflexia bacterium]|nr:hypothetical protein [Chloroflexia bacterium]